MKKTWFFLSCYYFICVSTIALDGDNDATEKDINFLNQMQNKLILTRNQNVVMVLGNTGCGKSTLVHYVANDYSKLVSEESPNPHVIDFKIRDDLDPDRDRITLPTESRTLIPVLTVDETNTVFCDNPGYGDTRNETVEIAAMCLVKRVIESASNIKMVLVVNYDSVTESNNREDFENLLIRSTELMKNIARFENSVSLVVTKAPSIKVRGSKVMDIFDDSIKNSTVHFMHQHRLALKKKGSSANKIHLIDALLKTDSNGDYPRISVFWRPNDSGPFDKIEKMVNGRRLIRESILNHTSYAEVHLNDFGFPLTVQAKIKVQIMVEHTKNRISTILQKTIDQLLIEMRQQIQSSDTVQQRLQLIDIGKMSIEQFNINNNYNNNNNNNNTYAITLKQLTEQLNRLIQAYNTMSIDIMELSQIEQNENNLNTLYSLITSETNDANASHKLQSFDSHSFLKQIITFLTDYEIEIKTGIKNKARETIEIISTILTRVDNQLLTALQAKIESVDGFQNRLELLKQGKCKSPATQHGIGLKQRVEQIKNLTRAFDIDSVSFRDINQIVHYEKTLNTLKPLLNDEIEFPTNDWMSMSNSSIDYHCSMYDWYSFLEEVFQHFNDYDNRRNITEKPTVDANNFKTFTKRIRRSADFSVSSTRLSDVNGILDVTLEEVVTECDGNTFIIKGVAIKSSDIEPAIEEKCTSRDDLTNVKVFALKKFFADSDLNFSKEKEVQLEIIAPIWDVKKNSVFYLNGLNGEPLENQVNEGLGHAGRSGKSGTNAGNFIGWADEINNGDWLTIELNGGDGANGENGASSPDVAPTFNETLIEISGDKGVTESDKYYLNYFRERDYIPMLVNSTTETSHYLVKYNKIFYHQIMLYPGYCCAVSVAGAGGPGGQGGSRGDFKLFGRYSDSSEKIQSIAKNGKDGKKGKNGRTCKTYKLQLDIYTTLEKWLMGRHHFKGDVQGKTLVEDQSCRPKAVRLIHGDNAAQRPIRLHEDKSELATTVVEYNSFLYETMKDATLIAIAQQVHKAFNSPDSNDIYVPQVTLKELVLEAIELEKQSISLTNSVVDVLPLYDNIVQRMKLLSIPEDDEEQQTTLKLVNTLIQSKLSSFQNNRSGDLIIKIENYLNLIISNIGETSELERIKIINKQRQDYNNGTLAKIQEATDLIKYDIKPAIEHIFTDINVELKNSIDEVHSMEARTIREIEMKKKHSKIVKKNAVCRGLLLTIEIVAEFVNRVSSYFWIDIGSATVGVGARLWRRTKVDPSPINSSAIPAGVQHFRDHLFKTYREKLETIEAELNRLKVTMSSHNVASIEFFKELSEYQHKIHLMKTQMIFNHDELVEFTSKCLKFLREYEVQFTNPQMKKKTDVVEAISTAHDVILASVTSFSSYKQMAGETPKVEKIASAIHEDREIFEELRLFESNIYKEILPSVDNLYHYLADAASDAVHNTSIILDVSQIRNALRNVQRKLNDDLTGFENIERLNDCIKSINEAITLLLETYDRIQNYNKDTELVNYLSELQEANFENVYIHDNEYRELLNELKLNIHKNFVLGQFNRAIDAFKQAVFPYAAEYLDMYDLPSVDAKNTTLLIEHATETVKSLRNKIIEFNETVISTNDQFIHLAYFDGQIGSQGPFYKFNLTEKQDKIDGLFNGSKVFLEADINNTLSDSRNAIKFSKIELKFTSENETLNDELNKHLQKCHVSLTHMGNSNYRCNKTFYSISSLPLTQEYSIAERNNSPADRSLARDKLIAGAPLLSPYAIWEVQLLHGNFTLLEKLNTSQINMELHGFGQYIKENAPICETNLGKYYKIKTIA